jgi:hypothetical protein
MFAFHRSGMGINAKIKSVMVETAACSKPMPIEMETLAQAAFCIDFSIKSAGFPHRKITKNT